jgi:hypothetical protein
MGLWGISNILLCTGLFIIFYFSYSSSLQDDKTDSKEFLKLSGILILLATICLAFFEISFLAIRAVSWLIIYAYTITLLLVNGGGAYMIWELHKERKEEEKFKNENQSNFDSLDQKSSLAEEVVEEDIIEKNEDMALGYQDKTQDEIQWKQDDKLSDKSTINTDTFAEDDLTDENESTHEYPLFSKISISHRVAKILHEAGINTLEQLIQHTSDELKEKKNIGEKSLHEIVNALEKAGHTLKS